jgi:arsenate reductase
MNGNPYTVLFLCTGNSARSLMAEALLNVLGQGRFRAYSAGSHPTGTVNPLTLEPVKTIGYPLDALRSKSWEEFAQPGAPPMDFIITVCDAAAGEACPIWLGRPITAHWGVPHPAAVQGTEAEKRRAFEQVFARIRARIMLLVSLRLDDGDPRRIQHDITRLGETPA